MSDTTSIQQQEARELATRCATVLRQRFGARRVIPFGSVVEHGTWHPGSDLDLAVEGIAPEQFFRAWSVLRELLPPGLDVDLGGDHRAIARGDEDVVEREASRNQLVGKVFVHAVFCQMLQWLFKEWVGCWVFDVGFRMLDVGFGIFALAVSAALRFLCV